MRDAVYVPVWVAAIAAVAMIAGPVLLAWVTERLRARAQREDWARQEVVARRLMEATAATAKLAQAGNAQLVEIKGAVNGSLTDAIRGHLAAQEALAHVLRERVADRADRHLPVSPEDAELLRATEARAAELRAQVDDRAGPG